MNTLGEGGVSGVGNVGDSYPSMNVSISYKRKVVVVEGLPVCENPFQILARGNTKIGPKISSSTPPYVMGGNSCSGAIDNNQPLELAVGKV